MRFVAIVCLAVVVTARPATKVASFVVSINTDEWCHEHHLGSGPSSCVMHNGCCFSDYVSDLFDNTQELGPCHSCDAHQDEWCRIYGGVTTDSCLALGGCTFDSTATEDDKKCISASPEIKSTVRLCLDDFSDTESIASYAACCEAAEAAGVDIRKSDVEGGCKEYYFYTPECAVEGEGRFFAATQADQDGIGMDGYFCVDENGHELPDSRKETDLKIWNVDCDKMRKESVGMQCPNAITLTTKGGVVIVNDDNDAEDCTVTCNTDVDCAGEDWCCFNGCGYSCQLPIKPMSGCADVPGDGLTQGVSPVGDATEIGSTHGVQIMLTCAEGFDVVDEPAGDDVDFRDPWTVPAPEDLQPEGTKADVQEVKLECKHGHWQSMDGDRDINPLLDCNKQCGPYRVEGISLLDKRALRERDFVVKGDPLTQERHHYHTAKVTIECPTGYGVVVGEERAKESGYEVMFCNEGNWENQFDTKRSMECSVCYDAYEHEWRDAKGNACLYYKSRPMECNANQGAIDNCRVSCRSCMQAEELFKVKNTVESLFDVPAENRKNWNRVGMWVPVEKTRVEKQEVQVMVTVQLTMDQVCTDGAGTNMRKPEAGCPDGFTPMA